MRPLHATTLLLLLSIAACHERKPDLAPAPVTFKSNEFPYRASYDLNRWRILAPSERDLVMSQADVVFTNTGASHFLSISAERSDAGLTELRTRALISLQQKGPDLKVLAQNPVTVAGAPALMVQLQATIRETPIAFEIVFLQYGGIAYQLAYWASIDGFNERTNDFRRFVATFEPAVRQSAGHRGYVAYPSPTWSYILTLPAPEWAPSEQRLTKDADQQFETPTGVAYVLTVAERLLLPLDTLVERGIDRLRVSSQGRFKATAITDMTVDGTPAKLVHGETTIEGTTYRYSILFTSRQGIAYQFAGWAPADLFAERFKNQFGEIFAGIQFIR